MKRRTGCEACRLRHRKCVFPTGGKRCYGCFEAGKDCLRAPKFVFTHDRAAVSRDPEEEDNSRRLSTTSPTV